MMGGGEKLFNLRQRLMRAPRVLGPAFGPGGKIGSQRTRRWREMDSNHLSPAAKRRAIAMISSAFLLNAGLPRAAGMARAARGRSRFDLV